MLLIHTTHPHQLNISLHTITRAASLNGSIACHMLLCFFSVWLITEIVGDRSDIGNPEEEVKNCV